MNVAKGEPNCVSNRVLALGERSIFFTRLLTQFGSPAATTRIRSRCYYDNRRAQTSTRHF